MPQLNIYVPDDLEKEVKLIAKKRGVSLSAFVSEVLRNNLQYGHWQHDFFEKTAGKWKGSFPEIERVSLEDDEAS